MSKIQKIKEIASQGKGLNDKAAQYLLSYIESLERENQHLWKAFHEGYLSGESLRQISKARIASEDRKREDSV